MNMLYNVLCRFSISHGFLWLAAVWLVMCSLIPRGSLGMRLHVGSVCVCVCVCVCLIFKQA